MLDAILAMSSFSEKKASQYVAIILSAIKYMHSLDVVHRDLKARNMVFDKPGMDGTLQLIDFGESIIIDEEEEYAEFVGTGHDVAPEVTRPRTGWEMKKSDMWSIGVITYLLVCGSTPFVGRTHEQILKQVTAKNKKINYPSDVKLTKSCKHFIESLLCHDVEQRLSAAEALQHGI